MIPTFTTDEVLARLRILHRKLEDDGTYVRANTVFLGIEEIVRLRPDAPTALEQSRTEAEWTAFQAWWKSSGHAADPTFTLTMENCAHAAWQARARAAIAAHNEESRS